VKAITSGPIISNKANVIMPAIKSKNNSRKPFKNLSLNAALIIK
jgi:hypothetical protein